MTTNRVYRHDGDQFSVTGKPGRYEVALRCDCLFGPHWHLLTVVRTVAEAEAVIKADEVTTVEFGEASVVNEVTSL